VELDVAMSRRLHHAARGNEIASPAIARTMALKLASPIDFRDGRHTYAAM
jgi:hypothetical protein